MIQISIIYLHWSKFMIFVKSQISKMFNFSIFNSSLHVALLEDVQNTIQDKN